MDGMIEEKIGALAVYRWKMFETWRDRFTAALTTRLGGCSPAPFCSLNLAQGAADEPENVLSNRRRVSRALNFDNARWALCSQVHGISIADASADSDFDCDSAGAASNSVSNSDCDCAGAMSNSDFDCDSTGAAVEEAAGAVRHYNSRDGIYLEDPRIAAAVFLADCHPVIIYDPVRHAAAALHAGWRGTVLGIAAEGVRRMLESGSRIEDLTAVSGPGIGPCCYRVGEDVGRRFQKSFGGTSGFTRRISGSDIWFADIEEANVTALQKAGVKRIGRAGFCTACRTDQFFSHRIENGSTGRQAAVIMLR